LNGSFDNPAGFAACICAGAPLLLPFIVSKLKWMRYSALVSVGLIALSVVLSGSRAGMLSLTVVSVLYLCNRFRIKLIFPLIACVVLAVGLYFVKKDSADGRLLIWRVSSEMFKEKPALGYGYGGFNANYMNFQARYFEAHPDSKYARIADNVRNPFNEYVKLLVNYGFAGLVAFLTLCSFLYLSFRRIKNKTITDYAALYALEAIAVFAFFSYPLTYPFVLIVGTVNVCLPTTTCRCCLPRTIGN